MKSCARLDDVVQALTANRWPQDCGAELREHVAGCPPCSQQVQLRTAFRALRESAMRAAPAPSADLLWWKAQVHRRQAALDQLQGPAWTVSAAVIGASAILLVAVLASAWKHADWGRRVLAAGSVWGAWTLLSIAVLFCGFAVVAVLAAVGSFEERR